MLRRLDCFLYVLSGLIHLHAKNLHQNEKDTKKRVDEMRKEEAKRYKGATPDCYIFPDEPEFVQVSAKLAKEIEEKGFVYRDRPEKVN